MDSELLPRAEQKKRQTAFPEIEPFRPPAASSARRQKELFPRSWNRLLVSVPSLKVAWLALKRANVVKDIRRLILWTYLGRFAFHDETATLVKERIDLAREFVDRVHQNHLMQCVRFETRLLHFETGEMTVVHQRNLINRGHPRSHRLSHCIHQGVWARVRFPEGSGSLCYWAKHVLE